MRLRQSVGRFTLSVSYTFVNRILWCTLAPDETESEEWDPAKSAPVNRDRQGKHADTARLVPTGSGGGRLAAHEQSEYQARYLDPRL
jgi:hypothetical protein